jgi:N-acyl-D-amino-acid deacylase
MYRALVSILAICMFPGTEYAQDRVRPAIERIVPLLERAAAGSADQRECFTCHSQGLPILALTEARLHGFHVDEANWQRQLDHTYAHLNRNQEKYAKGEGTGGKADTAGYALWALATGDRAADATTTAVAEYLLSWQSSDDHWSCTSDRPPSEASDFTTTYLALRGLVDYGTDAQQDRIAARRESARDWLIDAAPEDTEDHVFRMWALQLAGADANVVASAASDLLGRQRADGGWSQLDDKESDAYATATALVALQRTGSLAAGDEAYQRGVDYLLGAQLADGSWHVVSRSDPFQTYYESGFPHGEDQFISTTASAWAALALLAVAPEKPAEPTSPPQSERKSRSSRWSSSGCRPAGWTAAGRQPTSSSRRSVIRTWARS